MSSPKPLTVLFARLFHVGVVPDARTKTIIAPVYSRGKLQAMFYDVRATRSWRWRFPGLNLRPITLIMLMMRIKADKDDESKGDALLMLLLLERRPCSIYYLQGLIGHCIEIAPWPRVAVTSFNPPLLCDNLTSHP